MSGAAGDQKSATNMFAFLETFWRWKGRKSGIWILQGHLSGSSKHEAGHLPDFKSGGVDGGALCDTGNIRKNTANSERIARQLGLRWTTIF